MFSLFYQGLILGLFVGGQPYHHMFVFNENCNVSYLIFFTLAEHSSAIVTYTNWLLPHMVQGRNTNLMYKQVKSQFFYFYYYSSF